MLTHLYVRDFDSMYGVFFALKNYVVFLENFPKNSRKFGPFWPTNTEYIVTH